MAKMQLGDKEFECSDVDFVLLSTVFLEAVVNRKYVPFISLGVVSEGHLISFTDSFSSFVDDFIKD